VLRTLPFCAAGTKSVSYELQRAFGAIKCFFKHFMMYCVKEETNFFTIHHGWRLICGKCEKQSWERRLRESALSLRLEVGSEMLPECWKHLQAANKHLTRKEPL